MSKSRAKNIIIEENEDKKDIVIIDKSKKKVTKTKNKIINNLICV
jgi:hypothetical protein